MSDSKANPTLKELLMEHVELTLTLRKLKITFDPAKCVGVFDCIEVCPVGCWETDREEGKAIHVHPDRCIACGACVLQCPEKAIILSV